MEYHYIYIIYYVNGNRVFTHDFAQAIHVNPKWCDTLTEASERLKRNSPVLKESCGGEHTHTHTLIYCYSLFNGVIIIIITTI